MLKSKNKLLHKALAFVLTFSLLATLVSFNFTASALEESGTADNPYIITNEQDLKDFATAILSNPSACAKLSENANISISTAWTPIGGSTEPTTYTGVFDGNGGTINFSGIADGEYIGLFASNAGTIKNLTVSGTVSAGTTLAFAGGIAGQNKGNITNCTSNITFTTNVENAVIGGITAVSSGKISNCTNTGAITVSTNTNTGDVTNKEATAGGIVGLNLNGTVEKSTNSGAVSNTDSNGYAGGIVGCNYGTINNCLNTKSVSNDTTSQYAGGIAGYLFKDEGKGDATISNSLNAFSGGNIIGSNGLNDNSHIGTIENCYYNSETDDSIDGTNTITGNELTDGTIAYKLNGESSANPVWGQKIEGNDKDLNPVIGITETSDNIVYANEESTGGYTNTQPANCAHEFENGICKKCNYTAIKVEGYNLIDNGQLGLKYKITIGEKQKDYATKNITFQIDGDSNTITESLSVDTDGFYYATVYVDSDELTKNITATITVTNNSGTTITCENNYRVYDYLYKLYMDSASFAAAGKAEELKTLVQAMATYDYYSTNYFKYHEYNNELLIPLSDISTVSTNSEGLNAQSVTTDSGDIQHYSSNVQLLSSTYGMYSAKVYNGNATLPTFMGYKAQGSESYTFVETTISGDKATGKTASIPAAELGNDIEIVFANSDSDICTGIKTASPYTYIYTVLNAYGDNSAKTDIVKLVKSLYVYGEAAKAYFNA